MRIVSVGAKASQGLGRGGVVLFACAAVVGCGGYGKTGDEEQGTRGKVVVVFVDRSASTVGDREVYERAFEKIIPTLKAGDRIVVSVITQATATDFKAAIDATAPERLAIRTLSDNELQYRKKETRFKAEMETFQQEVTESVARVLSGPSSSPYTAIFESMRIAQQIFAGDSRRAVLVLMSDMQEDSPLARLEKTQLTRAFAESVIKRHEEAALLPSLKGVRVYVVGAHGRTAKQTVEIEEFWKRYFEKTGAIIPAGGMGITLAQFDE